MVLLIFTLLTYLKGIADKAIQKKEIDLKKEEMDLKNYTNPVNENKERNIYFSSHNLRLRAFCYELL